MRTHSFKTLLTLIEACKHLQQLKQIHARSTILGLTYNEFILTKLSASFLSIESLEYASRLFDKTPEPGVFIWNAMIKAHSALSDPIMAILMYNRMQEKEKVVLNHYTFTFVLKACANLLAVEKGREIHGLIVRKGLESDRFSQSSLLNLYMFCGEIRSAQRVFVEFEWKDVVFWNAMIMGYARKGMIQEALLVFGEMTTMGEIMPSEGTMLGLITACIESKNLKLGREIHGYVRKDVGLSEDMKLGAALIDLYMKNGCSKDARKVFDEMPEKNIIVWNSLINGYSQAGSLAQAIDLFQEMYNSDTIPDRFTISALLSGCAQTGAFNLGNWIREFAENNGIWDGFIGTTLIDMYTKCGFVGMAREVFDKMPDCERTLATWNAIISGYASHGNAEPIINLFSDMEKSGARPDSVTFLAILHACAHAGLVERGKQYFEMMKYKGIAPKVEHYGCMVDLLGRAGLVIEARKLIETMEMEPNVVIWGSLLGACSIHGDIDTGEWAADHIFKLDKMDGGSYVLLGNLYAATRRFGGAKAIREMMIERGIRKPLGCSMIDIGDCVHEFGVSDQLHPKSQKIYSVLDELSKKLNMVGYMLPVALDEEHSETN